MRRPRADACPIGARFFTPRAPDGGVLAYARVDLAHAQVDLAYARGDLAYARGD